MRKLFTDQYRRSAAGWLGACLLLAAGCTAVDHKAAPADATAPAAAAGGAASTTPSDKPKQCYNGCQQWGESCNVDPRGVYRCQRRCAKFGEICE